MPYEKCLIFFLLESSKNVGNFCKDEKFFVTKIFFELVFYYSRKPYFSLLNYNHSCWEKIHKRCFNYFKVGLSPSKI